MEGQLNEGQLNGGSIKWRVNKMEGELNEGSIKWRVNKMEGQSKNFDEVPLRKTFLLFGFIDVTLRPPDSFIVHFISKSEKTNELHKFLKFGTNKVLGKKVLQMKRSFEKSLASLSLFFESPVSHFRDVFFATWNLN